MCRRWGGSRNVLEKLFFDPRRFRQGQIADVLAHPSKVNVKVKVRNESGAVKTQKSGGRATARQHMRCVRNCCYNRRVGCASTLIWEEQGALSAAQSTAFMRAATLLTVKLCAPLNLPQSSATFCTTEGENKTELNGSLAPTESNKLHHHLSQTKRSVSSIFRGGGSSSQDGLNSFA